MTDTPPDPSQPSGSTPPPYPGPTSPPPPPPYPGAYPTGGYPAAYPTGPGGAPMQRPPAPEQPPSMALAVKLMLIGAALSVVSLVYSFTTLDGLKDQVTDQLRENDPYVSQSVIDAAYGVSVGLAVVFGLLGAFLWVWMAWKNGQGRSWARVVATVFAGLNLLGLLFTVASSSTAEPLSLVLSVLSGILGVVVLVLLWRRESSEFFTAAEASRRLY
ncbi:hypothetical protein [Aeromicrobium wangtongii]|uniref:DUF2127 domain-containing protein n=1 Tax=Aeromicrobium wangtongii TaxID=2969247 RepID=A0ABY5M641_9ACTN|nr:hypothetical protein [Aeromicrobium wangtongii]MCD9199274.1 hypothetical protein [Aeromicrobium wangtongii]UUP13635.1 hypothetical protein NQV15_17570 [Aeromicrobium wangtongii]